MTLPKPIKDVIDFVLALPSALDKGSGPPVRALGESGPMAICPECERLVRLVPSSCYCPACRGTKFFVPHDHPEWQSECFGSGHGWKPSALCPSSGIRSEPIPERAVTRLTEGQSSAPGPRKTEERSRICNMRWANTTVLLGDTDFVRCRFFNCKLIDDGPFSMERCLMENCTIQSRDSYEKTSSPARFVR